MEYKSENTSQPEEASSAPGRLSQKRFLPLGSTIYSLRFFLLLILQTGIFTMLYMVLPNGRNRFWDSLPGALLASSGWLVFSDLYSIYVEHFAHLSTIYSIVKIPV